MTSSFSGRDFDQNSQLLLGTFLSFFFFFFLLVYSFIATIQVLPVRGATDIIEPPLL